ncbi:MAG TPA: nitronate monooxygenase family protein [Candidatus Binatia bacterium]|nr:nitronate monooxygenase family protein [Candidatus Binatia bacterium]
MLRTPLCSLLGIDVPIFSAPMGPDITGPDLVAAVSGAGGLGILQSQLSPPPLLREQIARIRSRTQKPFGVNFLLQFPSDDGIATCIEERVPVLSFFRGEPPTAAIERAHAAGLKVVYQVGSVAAAARAARAGVDVVIAQGVEAGGHLAGEVSTLVLVPRVVEAIAPVPVAAAGGIGDARGVAAVLALGAQAAVLGTRFLASAESHAHPRYKERVVDATEEDTVKTTLFGRGWPNAPHRAIRTRFVEEWLASEARGNESRPDEPVVGESEISGMRVPIVRFTGLPPNARATGDLEAMGMLAGQSAGLVRDVRPAGEIVRDLAAGAERIIARELLALTLGSGG